MSRFYAPAASPRHHAVGWSLPCLWLVCTVFSAMAHGQPRTPRMGDPADAGAAVPALVWISPLPQAPRATPVSAGHWRDANDTTARIGGWRAYLREAQTPASGASAPATTPPMHKH